MKKLDLDLLDLVDSSDIIPTVRLVNCLRAEQTTGRLPIVKDIIANNYDTSALLKIPNMGRKTAKELVQIVKTMPDTAARIWSSTL